MASGFKSIDADTALRLYESGARIIDVRSDQEWAAGHVEGADRMAVSEIKAAHIGRADAVIAVCRNGSKSKRAAKKLAKLGYRAYHLAGGLKAWRDRGHPLVSRAGRRAEIV